VRATCRHQQHRRIRFRHLDDVNVAADRPVDREIDAFIDEPLDCSPQSLSLGIVDTDGPVDDRTR